MPVVLRFYYDGGWPSNISAVTKLSQTKMAGNSTPKRLIYYTKHYRYVFYEF
jgi:hypothetical protein